MKKYFLPFLLLASFFSANAQMDIEPSQLVPASDFITTDDLQIEWTLGDAFSCLYILDTYLNYENLYLTQFDIKVIGNPVTAQVQIEYSNENQEPVECRIYNAKGAELSAKQIINHRTKIPVDQFADGIYFISFYTQNGLLIKTCKIVKQ